MTIRHTRVSIADSQAEGAKANLPQYVKQVEKAKNGFGYRIQFRGLDEPGFITEKQGHKVFTHFCEDAAAGKSCKHMVVAKAVALLAGEDVTVFGLPSVPTVPTEIDLSDMEDMNASLSLPVIKPASTPTPAPAVTAGRAPSTPAPNSKPTSAKNVVKTEVRDWQEGWSDVHDYLLDQGMSMRVITSIEAMRKQICKAVPVTEVSAPPTKPKTPYMGPVFGRAMRHILNGKALLLNGDKGTGKDTLINTISWVLSLPLYLTTGNVDETKESVVGDNTLKATSNGSEIEFKNSPFAIGVEKGGLTHYAEMNMISGNVTSIFHSVLDENAALPTPDGTIKRHKNHVFIGSVNVGEQYTGTQKLNGALVDRMVVLNMPYVADFKTLISKKIRTNRYRRP
ncbi:AAA family ATPase [Aneurinibacillus tyrosinisolvens]|uniref:AAA family ATPase n=1 Tax=Aneurinibacillus tyrosinisolvens TaxID=1443435 RepID=UPI00063F4B43|nr:AAA family ATPase [Aneurinibacillus tyrosinisolvens]